MRYRETGALVVRRREILEGGTRFGRRVELIELDAEEGLDIDDWFDWWLAEKVLERRTIVFRVEGHKDMGLGHVYRTLALGDCVLASPDGVLLASIVSVCPSTEE